MAADRDTIRAASHLLDTLGVTLDDLHRNAGAARLPTIAEYLPRVMTVVSETTRASYTSYWNRIHAEFGERPLDQVDASEIATLMQTTKAAAVRRRNSRGGRAAADHLLLAFRLIYTWAAKDGLISRHLNPSRRVARPRRLPSTRRALTAAQLAELTDAAILSSRDPTLDSLLLRLHTETACRRGGALALRLRDLDPDLCLVLLREKGGTHRWQPVSPTLATALCHLAANRGAAHPDDALLRTRARRPLTPSHYDALWTRVHTALPWTAVQGVSTHWLRHTTLTWVERHYGYGIARAFAGHTDRKGGSTTTYIRATLEETATALAALAGEPHPLARGG